MNPLTTTRLNLFRLPAALTRSRGPTSLLHPHPGSFFSTSTRLLETSNNPTPTGTEPSFFKRLGATPCTRVFLIGCFVVLASVETLGWFNFGPKILGWDKSGEEK